MNTPELIQIDPELISGSVCREVPMLERSLPLLQVREVDQEGAKRHYLCFRGPAPAVNGVDSRAVVGEFTPDERGAFNPASLRVNTQFISAITAYMNSHVSHMPALAEKARARAGGWVFLADPRHESPAGYHTNQANCVGSFEVDIDGKVIPGSFRYNYNHLLFEPEAGASGLFNDKQFYDWLSGQAAPPQAQPA
jgi:hypothetical protein